MTTVPSGDRFAWLSRLGLGGAVMAALWLAVLIVRSDVDAPRHSLWRDPISWFAADEAPDPEPVRAALVVLGAGLVVLAGAGWAQRRSRLATSLVALAGALVVCIGLVPIECSMRIDFCEKLVRNRLVGGKHLAHVVASLALMVVCVVAVGVTAWRTRRLAHLGAAAATVAAAATIVVIPTNPRVGPLQWIVLGGAIIGLVPLWRGETTRERTLS